MLDFCHRLGLDSDCTEVLLSAVDVLGEPLRECVTHYLKAPELAAVDAAATIAAEAEAKGISSYTRDAAFALLALFLSREELIAAHGEEIFYDSARDLVWKTRECYGRFGVYGTASLSWHDLILRKKIVALGRLQFHVVPFRLPEYKGRYLSLTAEDPAIKVHIPSSGKLTEELCLDSYRRAYRFFRDRFLTDIIPIACFTWLLDPELVAALPGGGLAAFASHYHIFKVQDDERNLNFWRVFGKDREAFDVLPRNTRMQAALADRLESGGCMKLGYGIFAHDGNRILK